MTDREPLSARKRRRLQVICDTPLGLEIAHLETTGKGGVIVTERVVEKFAEARQWKPEECELITITDEESKELLWP